MWVPRGGASGREAGVGFPEFLHVGMSPVHTLPSLTIAWLDEGLNAGHAAAVGTGLLDKAAADTLGAVPCAEDVNGEMLTLMVPYADLANHAEDNNSTFCLNRQNMRCVNTAALSLDQGSLVESACHEEGKHADIMAVSQS